MSDPDSAQRRRPPTIDLTAQEVATERPADAQDLGCRLRRDCGQPLEQGGANEFQSGRAADGRHLTSPPGLSEPP